MTHRFFIFPKKCDFEPEDAIFFIMGKWCYYESALRGTINEIVGVDVFSIVFEKNANPPNPPKTTNSFLFTEKFFFGLFFQIKSQLRQIHDDMDRATAP